MSLLLVEFVSRARRWEPSSGWAHEEREVSVREVTVWEDVLTISFALAVRRRCGEVRIMSCCWSRGEVGVGAGRRVVVDEKSSGVKTFR